MWCPKHHRCGFNDKIPCICEVRLCTFCMRSLPVSYLMQLFCHCPTWGSCSCALWGLCRSQQAFLFFCSSASGSSAIIRHYVEEAINGMEAGRLPSNCGENLRGRLRVPQTCCPRVTPSWGSLEREWWGVGRGWREGYERGVVTSNVIGCTKHRAHICCNYTKVWRLNCNCTPIKGVKTAKSSCFELQLLFHPICASLSDGLNCTSNCRTWINSRFITLSSLLGLGGRGFMSATNYHHIMSNKIPFIKLYCPIKHLRNKKPIFLVNGVVIKYVIFVYPMQYLSWEKKYSLFTWKV